MPEVQFARNSGKPWGGAFFQVVGHGLFIVSSYWTAFTLGWAVHKATVGLEGQSRADFKGLCLTCLLGLSLPALGIALLGGLPIIGFAVAALIGPIAGYAPNILRVRKTPPLYARAIARMKFGKYKEAEWEIIRELEKSENDFDGWMMLAELYAKNFNDLPEAEQTVLEICDQPRTTPSQLSVALHRLSDGILIWRTTRMPPAARCRWFVIDCPIRIWRTWPGFASINCPKRSRAARNAQPDDSNSRAPPRVGCHNRFFKSEMG